MEIAVLGGGCFWCTEAVFRRLKGVKEVMPGYTGGEVNNPSYEQVCSGKTGHAEVIKIDFDPEVIQFKDLLTVFFATHDPTTLNRQGNDIGTQYRSVVFYSSEDQKREAEEYIKEIESEVPGGDPIVTQIEELGKFYPAEDYHRDYYERNRANPYCFVVINPKVAKVKEKFRELIKDEEEQ